MAREEPQLAPMVIVLELLKANLLPAVMVKAPVEPQSIVPFPVTDITLELFVTNVPPDIVREVARLMVPVGAVKVPALTVRVALNVAVV